MLPRLRPFTLYVFILTVMLFFSSYSTATTSGAVNRSSTTKHLDDSDYPASEPTPIPAPQPTPTSNDPDTPVSITLPRTTTSTSFEVDIAAIAERTSAMHPLRIVGSDDRQSVSDTKKITI